MSCQLQLLFVFKVESEGPREEKGRKKWSERERVKKKRVRERERERVKKERERESAFKLFYYELIHSVKLFFF